MHRQIGERAGHRLLAEAMSHVDYGAEDLERLEAERRAEQRQKFGGGGHKSCNALNRDCF